MARMETWRLMVQVTLPPAAEHAVLGSRTAPKGVPGINNRNVYCTSTRFSTKVDASGSESGAGVPVPGVVEQLVELEQISHFEICAVPVPLVPRIFEQTCTDTPVEAFSAPSIS